MVSYDAFRVQLRIAYAVLILIVVDNGPVLSIATETIHARCVVLILVVVDNGLVLERFGLSSVSKSSLNPYYSGRWSRTMHDWRKFAWKKGS